MIKLDFSMWQRIYYIQKVFYLPFKVFRSRKMRLVISTRQGNLSRLFFGEKTDPLISKTQSLADRMAAAEAEAARRNAERSKAQPPRGKAHERE